MLDLTELNDAQAAAVTADPGPLLVLAGAGSGKTRVLTWRIAHLIETHGVAPYRILAITFTNKAAAEMRERIDKLLGTDRAGMWIYTFHACCLRILRTEAEHLGYRPNFTIYDDDDSKRLVKDIMREQGMDTTTIAPNTVRNLISDAKNQMKGSGDLSAFGSNPVQRAAQQVYPEYDRRLLAANAMDFDDLLLNVVRLFQQHPDVLAAWQRRFDHVLVDEYQDTNHAQYLIARLLAAQHRNLMVVGDDDQSIYSWRGADITNILEFERDWPDATVIKLEQNYRSTANILDAANALVAHNVGRKAKSLYTTRGAGAAIGLYLAQNEHDEARYIAARIDQLSRNEARPLSDFAVFYRTNAQSRVLEDALLRAGLPYRIVGGTRYFDRAEIRDVTAYLKVVVNPADEVNLRRIINTPRRGIGSTSLETLTAIAAACGVSLEAAMRLAVADDGDQPSPSTPHPPLPRLKAAARNAVAGFLQTLDEMRSYAGELPRVVEAIITASGLLSALQAAGTDEAQARAENLQEFVNVAADYAATHDDDQQTLPAFMEWLALRTDLDALSAESDSVTLMTVHTAKGLEYPVVFVAGLEESLFPHANAVFASNADGLEEERRLAYVAITRARERLCLTHASSRMSYGSPVQNNPSRFIGELPRELLEIEGVGSAGFQGTSGWDKRGDRHGVSGHGVAVGDWSPTIAKPKKAEPAPKFAVGDTVSHKVWGRGEVQEIAGEALYVHFPNTVGRKKLVVGFAPIVKVTDG
ncbi:MAG: UvrD-helicase domain-containing protein [Actinomycetes bacterium]|nr:UvrD-helicase domain-containing protein [Actinomycetes bacterium]